MSTNKPEKNKVLEVLNKVYKRERKEMINNMRQRDSLAWDYEWRYETKDWSFTLKWAKEAFDNLDFDSPDDHTSYDQWYMKWFEDAKVLIEKSI